MPRFLNIKSWGNWFQIQKSAESQHVIFIFSRVFESFHKICKNQKFGLYLFCYKCLCSWHALQFLCFSPNTLKFESIPYQLIQLVKMGRRHSTRCCIGNQSNRIHEHIARIVGNNIRGKIWLLVVARRILFLPKRTYLHFYLCRHY